jgi:hypothetical protein
MLEYRLKLGIRWVGFDDGERPTDEIASVLVIESVRSLSEAGRLGGGRIYGEARVAISG